ncbi:Pet127-domain-containing protein [Martensiomyces pterosporus]|nr:Pet127-domain-containing protein [Martensiomyces pterosporus]
MSSSLLAGCQQRAQRSASCIRGRLHRYTTTSSALAKDSKTKTKEIGAKVPVEEDDTTAGEKPRVVEAGPIYAKDDTRAGSNKDHGPRKGRPGARTDYIREREPVVVHDLTYPIQNSKWYRINPEKIEFNQVGSSHISRVPRLAHGLERVLFSPGVHCLQDPHSGVYNFDPYIRNITQPEDFDYDKLTPYITSSQDETLMKYARMRRRQFVGSTSSMTHVLSHLYFIVSAWKQPDISSMSMAFADMPNRFTRGMRYPASIALRYHDGVYGIDADKSFDVQDSILSILGKSLEKLLTSTPQEFDMYKKQNSWKVKDIPEENYHYVEVDDFVLRSQLDCRDDRLPRKTFDLKTRGSLAIRMDMQNYEVSKGYQIYNMKGRLESFEREYYDMIRSAFLKYNFQTRIGNMDGIFVAYHNTAKMFGFQYINRREMDRVLYGNEPTGTKAFKTVLILLGKLLRTVTDQYPKKDLRVTFDSATRDKQLDIWVEVINDEAEALALQQFHENSTVRAAGRSKRTRPVSPAAAGSDPFAAKDPLESEPALVEDDAVDELDAEYLDPADDIYVNPEYPILRYTMEAFSTLNDQDTDQAVTVKTKDDEWLINWKLTKSRDPQSDTQRYYRNLRLKQATYFERAAPDTPDDELSPLVKILRRISRKNMWQNETPKGKVVVNRSRKPISPAKEPTAQPAPPHTSSKRSKRRKSGEEQNAALALGKGTKAADAKLKAKSKTRDHESPSSGSSLKQTDGQ